MPDLVTACEGSDILIFVIPHQFVENVCNQLKGHLKENVLAVSLIKVNVRNFIECYWLEMVRMKGGTWRGKNSDYGSRNSRLVP